MSKHKIVIFAGSREPKPEDLIHIKNFAKKIAYEGFDIVYGGGNLGVMGIVASEAQRFGSHITSVVVEKYSHEKQLDNSHIILVENDFQRFDIMMKQEGVVASFVFPGGPGTIRETFSALELAVYENGPPVILPKGFKITENIKTIFQSSLDENFINFDFKNSMPLISLEEPIAYFLFKTKKNLKLS